MIFTTVFFSLIYSASVFILIFSRYCYRKKRNPFFMWLRNKKEHAYKWWSKMGNPENTSGHL